MQKSPARKKKRHPSGKSKIAPFLPERQLWRWFGKGFKRPGAKGKGKKEYFKAIVRGKEMIKVSLCRFSVTLIVSKYFRFLRIG